MTITPKDCNFFPPPFVWGNLLSFGPLGTSRAFKRSPTHNNWWSSTCGPYHRFALTCSFHNSVLTIDHGQNVVNQETLSRLEEVTNNNVNNHDFYCLRLRPWTNIATMIVWVDDELFNTFSAALLIDFDHVVVLGHRHSVNENRRIRTFRRLKSLLWFNG